MTVTDTTWPFGTPPLDVTEAAFLAGRDNATKRLEMRCTDEEVGYIGLLEVAQLMREGAHHEIVLATLRGLLVGSGLLDVRDLPAQRAQLQRRQVPIQDVRRRVALLEPLLAQAEATLAEVRAARVEAEGGFVLTDAGTIDEVLPGGAL